MRRLMAVVAMVAAWLLVIAAPALAESVEPGTELSPRVIVVMVTPDLRMTDSNNVALKQIPVVPGETIMFVFTNTTGVDENFYIGTADQLRTNAVAGLPGVDAFSFGTKTLSWTVPQDITGLQFASTKNYGPEHGDFVVATAATPSPPPVSKGTPAPEPGPPFPQPVDGKYVYDFASVLSPEQEANLQSTIQAIRDRTAAEVVVYTQLSSDTDADSAEADAKALLDQWGVGRPGFFDGLAILLNLDSSKCHGRLAAWAGDGYRAAFLSDEERQKVLENDALPYLKDCDMGGALGTVISKVDANATPEHAQSLQLARQFNAAIGLVGGPLAFLVLVGAAGRAWLRYGKDPVYLDDPSILMPAPPPGLTAASASVVWEGKATRRGFTVGLLDLASRGEFVFEPEDKVIGRDKMGIGLLAAPPSDPYVERNRRRPLSEAENYLLTSVQHLGEGNPASTITSTELQQLAPKVVKFMGQLENHVSEKGWFREPPRKAIGRWSGIGVVAVIVGLILVIWLANLLSMSGLTLLGIGLVAGGIATVIIAQYMPARTMSGAMIYAMLAAYRRTLQYTMAQSRSMVDVVDQAKLAWLETPDQAVVWGVALGLNGDVEQVLNRTAEDTRQGSTTGGWLPIWYGGPSYGWNSGGVGGGGAAAGGLFSAGGLDFSGMTSALGTIGVAPSSSGSSGGGFSGGGSGGGGGGGGSVGF